VDKKARDLLDRFARLVTEYENLDTELRSLLPPPSSLTASDEAVPWAPSGEDLARWDWLTSRLREVQDRMRPMMVQMDRARREHLSGR